MANRDLVAAYPDLFQAAVWPWGPIQVQFQLLDAAPAAELVAGINIVPFVGRQPLIIQLADGSWEIPGGTLEPGESYAEAARRELREEVGAELRSFRLIGAWHCHTLRATPYRSHLPFPEFWRLVGIGEVVVVGTPTNPPDAEHVVKVEAVTVALAVQRFHGMGRRDLADLYRLATALRLSDLPR